MPSGVENRVTLVTTGLALGGAERQVCQLARGLQSRDWIVQVASLLPPEAFAEDLKAGGIPVHNLGMTPGVPDPRAIFRLAAHFRTFRPNVVHCHMVHANLLGRVARVLARVPVLISTAHSLREGGRWRDWGYRLTDGLSDLTTNVCDAGVRRYIARRLSRAATSRWIPNGIDVNTYAPNPRQRDELRKRFGWSSEFVWLAIGNLREPKDYPNLLRAFQLVIRQCPRTRLAIAGTGQLCQTLKDFSKALEIAADIHWLGARSDVQQLLQAADGFVISSAWEGTPLALLEACSSALPVVATAVGGNPEVVQHMKTGYLVEPGRPGELAKSMAIVMAMSPAARLEMGMQARARMASIYSLTRVLDKWEHIYQHLLQGDALPVYMDELWMRC